MESLAQANGRSPEQSMPLTLSNAMVKLYKDAFGRGPTKTRTDFAPITGRTVWASVSGLDTDTGIAAEVFYLSPQAEAA